MNNTAIVTPGRAPLYRVPLEGTELVDEVLHGMVVELLEGPSDGFYHIRTHYQYEGYLPERFLSLDRGLIEGWQATRKKVMMKSSGDIQTEPRIQAPSLTAILRGGLLLPIGSLLEGQWQKVLMADGRYGYTKDSYLKDETIGPLLAAEEVLRQRLTDAAESYFGTPYRWGGKTPLGIDCSGLTSMAYLLNGILIYRDADIREGFPLRKITKEQLGRGDLLFFPGHVAMYIEAGRYIHGTSHPGMEGVTYGSLLPDEPGYREDLADSILFCGTVF